jgi:hypothetical protein
MGLPTPTNRWPIRRWRRKFLRKEGTRPMVAHRAERLAVPRHRDAAREVIPGTDLHPAEPGEETARLAVIRTGRVDDMSDPCRLDRQVKKCYG